MADTIFEQYLHWYIAIFDRNVGVRVWEYRVYDIYALDFHFREYKRHFWYLPYTNIIVRWWFCKMMMTYLFHSCKKMLPIRLYLLEYFFSTFFIYIMKNKWGEWMMEKLSDLDRYLSFYWLKNERESFF